MADLPEEITTTVLELQRRLLSVITQATTTSYTILQIYGETETTIIALDDLDNAKERANIYYSRLHTLLGRIAEAQPIASNIMLELLNRAIDEAQATLAATEETIKEERRGFNLP